MIVGLRIGFWVCLCWVGGVFFFVSIFSLEFLSVIAVCRLLTGLPTCCIHRECLMVLVSGIQGQVEGREVRTDDLWDPRRCGQGQKGKEGCS